jgi:hypothetical protein
MDIRVRGSGGAGVRGCGGARVRMCGGAGVQGCGCAGVRGCGCAGVQGCGGARVRMCGGAGLRRVVWSSQGAGCGLRGVGVKDSGFQGSVRSSEFRVQGARVYDSGFRV